MYLTLFICIALVLITIGGGLSGWGRVKKDVVRFKESARELDNPNRGFYYIYDFWITDEETDYQRIVPERYAEYPDTELTMIQICLQDYREGEITEAGLKNIDALFDALETLDKQLIVRFVYDREGQSPLYEPQDIEIILGHMRQLETVLRKHSRQIFVVQGLFTGNWGEMHGTQYGDMESMRTLALQLAEVTEKTTYLAVRTPVQWRMVTQSAGPDEQAENDGLKGRLGLFNDGMLGNETDYGTYGVEETDTEQAYLQWGRRDELDFQNELCNRVPNGGEVIVPNVYNDIHNALDDMRTMHVTYLNGEHDSSVLEKWESSVVKRFGIFAEMDGRTYVERHLGYRIFIDKVKFVNRFWQDYVRIKVTLKNVGFAPMYRESDVNLIVYDKDSGQIIKQKLSCDLRNLEGGNDAGNSLIIQTDIELDAISSGKQEVYLEITDSLTGRRIHLANEQEEGEYGYLLGELECIDR